MRSPSLADTLHSVELGAALSLGMVGRGNLDDMGGVVGGGRGVSTDRGSVVGIGSTGVGSFLDRGDLVESLVVIGLGHGGVGSSESLGLA